MTLFRLILIDHEERVFDTGFKDTPFQLSDVNFECEYCHLIMFKDFVADMGFYYLDKTRTFKFAESGPIELVRSDMNIEEIYEKLRTFNGTIWEDEQIEVPVTTGPKVAFAGEI